MTEAELIALLPDLGCENKPDGWYTIAELSKLKGARPAALREWLSTQVREGAWEQQSFRTKAGTRVCSVACFRPKRKNPTPTTGGGT